MKSPFLLFTIKCMVILYLAIGTNIHEYNYSKSATPLITKSSCSINLFDEDEKTDQFLSYTFIFQTNGIVIAKKGAEEFFGKWMEDDIVKRIRIKFPIIYPTLSRLNNNWKIKDVNENKLVIESTEKDNPGMFTIASL